MYKRQAFVRDFAGNIVLIDALKEAVQFFITGKECFQLFLFQLAVGFVDVYKRQALYYICMCGRACGPGAAQLPPTILRGGRRERPTLWLSLIHICAHHSVPGGQAG